LSVRCLIDAGFVGSVEKDVATLQAEHKELFATANAHEFSTKVKSLIRGINPIHDHRLLCDAPLSTRQTKNRKRGKNKISAQLRRKQKNVIDAQLIKLKDKLAAAPPSKGGPSVVSTTLGALSRFAKK